MHQTNENHPCCERAEVAMGIIARVMEVVIVKATVGKGTEKDPNRVITEYWSKDGELLAVNDPLRD